MPRRNRQRGVQRVKLPLKPINERIGEVRRGDEIGNKLVEVVLWVDKHKAFFITSDSKSFSVVVYREVPKFKFNTVKTVSRKKYSLEKIINILAKKL